ncbi:MAG TPA: mechanosensitive ion channel [Burkholderiales bacterium]|nr:mechanosensitive ion channel [Burkholderiales bacterium]
MPTQLANLDRAKNTAIDLGIKFGPKLLVAILILVAGYYVGRWVGAFFDRWLGKLKLEPPVRLLLVRLARLLVIGLFLIMALQNLGVDLLPLIAGLSVAGAGIALAMQGVLGNLAAGLTIILTKPFRVGEYVAMVGVEGRVESIDLFTTKLSHPDRSLVVVPNRKIVGEVLHNYGEIRQLDLRLDIARAADLERALAAINEVVQSNARVLQEPAAQVGVTTLADKSIGIAVRPWVKVPDYVPAGAEINLAIVEKLGAAGVEYPRAAREIRVIANSQP